MQKDKLAALQLLQELGADVRAAGCLVAVDNNRPAMLRLLLDAGADAEEARRVEVAMPSDVLPAGTKESRDERPLYIAAKHGHEACVRMLLDHGVELGEVLQRKNLEYFWNTYSVERSGRMDTNLTSGFSYCYRYSIVQSLCRT